MVVVLVGINWLREDNIVCVNGLLDVIKVDVLCNFFDEYWCKVFFFEFFVNVEEVDFGVLKNFVLYLYLGWDGRNESVKGIVSVNFNVLFFVLFWR